MEWFCPEALRSAGIFCLLLKAAGTGSSPPPVTPLRDKALDNAWVDFILTHLSGIPVLRYCSILASILENEFFWVTFPEHASTVTTKYPE